MSIRFFYKVIPKSIGSVYYFWSRSYIYNINNNIQLALPKFKWVWLQHQTRSLWYESDCKILLQKYDN